MVFDEDPHGNKDMPLYFLWSCMVNLSYTSMSMNFISYSFKGWDKGCPKMIETMRGLIQTLYIALLFWTRNPPHLYSPAPSMLDDTQVALLQLCWTFICHVYFVEWHIIASSSRGLPSSSFDGGEEPSSGCHNDERPSGGAHDRPDSTTTT